MAEHTPGPWRMWTKEMQDDQGKVVGTLSWEIEDDSTTPAAPIATIYHWDDHAEANAALIAAAPDLLNAARAVMAQEDGYMDTLAEAIAKAEGQEVPRG